MHKPLKSATLEAMAMMMLGANAVSSRLHDYRHGIGKEARKKKKAKRRAEKQARRRH